MSALAERKTNKPSFRLHISARDARKRTSARQRSMRRLRFRTDGGKEAIGNTAAPPSRGDKWSARIARRQTTRRPVIDAEQLTTASPLTVVSPAIATIHLVELVAFVIAVVVVERSTDCSRSFSHITHFKERRPGEARVGAGLNDVSQMPPATPLAPGALRPAARSVDSIFIKCFTTKYTIPRRPNRRYS